MRPGLVLRHLKKSPSLPLTPAIPNAQTALQVSFTPQPSAPSTYITANADKPALFAPYQSPQIHFVIDNAKNAENKPYENPENKPIVTPFLKNPDNNFFLATTAVVLATVASINIPLVIPLKSS
jgi:hypothetical protein